MKFKVIIPTHNAAEYLDLQLYSLQKYATYKHEYVIVLDDCIDNTVDICKKYNTQYIEVNFHSPYLTRNYGVKQMVDKNEDIYLFMTADDMFASPEWDENIYSHIQKEHDVVWSSQLTDYLLYNTFEEIRRHNSNFTLKQFLESWALAGVHMDFDECGTTVRTFNEEIFLNKFKKLALKEGILELKVVDEDGGESDAMLCNTNFLIHNSFWHKLGGWPVSNTYPCDPKLGKANDILFQEKIVEVGGRNIVARDVIFFHFGGKTINRKRGSGIDSK